MTTSAEALKHAGRGPFAAAAPPCAEHGLNRWRQQRRRVVAILPRGEAIRNFVYSGALDEVARGADLTLLSVAPDGEFAQELRGRFPDLHLLEAGHERRAVRVVRELLDMAHGRWLWSKAAQERWLVHDAEARARGRRLQRTAKKLACYAFAHRAGLDVLTRIERAASRALRQTNDYVRLFKELRPALVFNGSHVHGQLAMQAVYAAQWLGIPTAAFIFSWDNLTSQGRIMPAYDFYLVWNEGLRQQLLAIYRTVRPEQVFVIGTPQFDCHFRREFQWSRTEFCARVGADPARPIVLYTTGMPNHMPGEPEIVAGLARMLSELSEFGPPQLLVRVSPKDQTGRFEAAKRALPGVLWPDIPWDSAWLTPRLEDAYLLGNMLRHAALGINIASTVSLELCMFDKPALNIGYNPPGLDISPIDYARYYEFDHYRAVVESGAVRVVTSESELRAALRQALAHPKADSPQRRALIKQMFGATLDGYAGLRVAHRLLELAAPGREAVPHHGPPARQCVT